MDKATKILRAGTAIAILQLAVLKQQNARNIFDQLGAVALAASSLELMTSSRATKTSNYAMGGWVMSTDTTTPLKRGYIVNA